MKCQKVPKNICKLCFQKVTNKNGLKCHGFCQTWVHFKCLNYTPGKIQDIKSGAIQVMCPCPHCDTKEPKEILAKPPFSCTNLRCPANLPPACESKECASKVKPKPYCPSCMQSSHMSCKSTQSQPVCPKCPPSPTCENPSIESDCSPAPKECTTGSTQQHNSPPFTMDQSVQKIESCTPIIGANESQSCSDLQKKCNDINTQQKMRPISSDSKVSANETEKHNEMLYSAIQNLCNTVGDLSKQLRYLMCKLETCHQ